MKKKKGFKTEANTFILSDVPSAHNCSKEKNLERLFSTSILTSFVNENNGTWDHQKWLELCDKVTKEGYEPIDFDQMGLMLERLKADFNAEPI